METGATPLYVERRFADVHNVTVESDRYIATQQGKLRCVEILVNARANVNCAKRANGSTALYVTAKEGHAKCMELLLITPRGPKEV